MQDIQDQPEAVIVIGTPSGGSAPDEFIQTLYRMGHGSHGRYLIVPINCQGSHIAHNQNNIVQGARDLAKKLQAQGIKRGVDAILFLENDEAIADPDECGRVIDRLWKSGKDIVGATYSYKDPFRLRAMGYELDGLPIDWLSLYHRDEFSKVAALPIGMLFVRMNVFDAMDAEEFLGTGPDGEALSMTAGPIFHHDVHFGMKLVRTTDYVFCTRATKMGFDVWLDAKTSLLIEHWGKFPYRFPDLAHVTQQIAALQEVADAHARAAEDENAPPHMAELASLLYSIVADMVRRAGCFAPVLPGDYNARIGNDEEDQAA